MPHRVLDGEAKERNTITVALNLQSTQNDQRNIPFVEIDKEIGSKGSIIRVEKRRNYTRIDNAAIQDKRLSFKAMGILVYLLTKPDNWQTYACQLAKAHTDGKDSVLSGLRELENHGYLIRRTRHDGRGRITGRESLVFECPQVTQNSTHPTVRGKSRGTEKPSSGKPGTSKYFLSTTTDSNKILSLPDWLSEKEWEEFQEHRAALKKPLTKVAAKKIIEELTRLKAAGNDPSKVLSKSIVSGWLTVFPLREQGCQVQGAARDAEFDLNPFSIKVTALPDVEVDW